MLRVYGTKGGLVWRQENPNQLFWSPYEKPTQILTRGGPGSGEAAARVTRVPPGHPEGYLEGFANIYSEVAAAIKAARDGQEAARGRAVPDHRGRRQGPRLHRGGGQVVQGQRKVGETVMHTANFRTHRPQRRRGRLRRLGDRRKLGRGRGERRARRAERRARRRRHLHRHRRRLWRRPLGAAGRQGAEGAARRRRVRRDQGRPPPASADGRRLHL